MTDEPARRGVDDVIITDELDRRPCRSPDYEAENRALGELAETMANQPGQVLSKLAELAMKLTRSDSACIGLLEPGGDKGIFRWAAAAGGLASNLGGTVRCEASPCGEVLVRDELLLVSEGDHAFPSLRDAQPKIYENLLAPFHMDGNVAGTVWVIKHSDDGRFDREDARLLQSLARCASAAHKTVRALQAARESEERYRLIVENARDYAILITDPDDIIVDWLPGAEAVFGWTREEAIGQPAGITFTPDDRDHREPQREIETAAGKGMAPDVRWHQRKDGRRVFIEGTVTPLRKPDGSIRGYLKIGQDVTERRAAQEALEASERRMRALVTGIPQMVFRSWDTGERIWGSPQWTEYTGLSFEESVGFGWLDAVHPDDRKATMDAWDGAEERGEYYVEHRIRHAASGEYRWHQTRAAPSRGSDGPVEWIGTSTDVEELRQLHRHQQTLLSELQHRVRNTLGVVRSIARRTAEQSKDVDEMASHFEGRLDAFSRVQAIATRNPEGGVDLAGLIEDELLAHAAREGEALRIEGPDVSLKPRPAETISLAIHELATNAVKYGALASEKGLIAVRWDRFRADGSETLRLVWEENGLDLPAQEPERQGFGLELLRRTLPYDLRAQTQMEFRPQGIRFEMIMPLGPDVLAAGDSSDSSG